jgi:hypothetical protein
MHADLLAKPDARAETAQIARAVDLALESLARNALLVA